MSFRPLEVPAGAKEFGYIDVYSSVAVTTTMPVGVVRSERPGPTLIVTAGLFPSEYCGIEAATRLYKHLQPESLAKGTVIVIPVVNLHGFQFRTPWLNVKDTASAPFDAININTVFPGSTADGASLTERQAAAAWNLVSQAQYHIDFRGGDLTESHVTHMIYPQLGLDAKLDAAAKELAMVFGVEYVLPAGVDDAHSQGGANDGALMGEAMKAGVCSVISECGLGFRTQPLEQYVMNHFDGAMNTLKHVGMMAGHPRYQAAAAAVGAQRYFVNPFVKAYAPASGVFTALKDQGEFFDEDEGIGFISGLDGETLATVRAPIKGIVHEMFPARVVMEGAKVFNLVAVGNETRFFDEQGFVANTMSRL